MKLITRLFLFIFFLFSSLIFSQGGPPAVAMPLDHDYLLLILLLTVLLLGLIFSFKLHLFKSK